MCALDHVSFSVRKGEFVSVIGASGSGKLTLLHLIGGVDRPTEGKVYVNGTDVYSQKEDALAIFRRRHGGTDLSVLQSDPGADSGGKYRRFLY